MIYGISRGGTTLLAETLVSLLSARLVWEPFFPYGDVKFQKINPFSVAAYAKFKFGWHPNVMNQNDNAIHAYFNDLFNLKIRNIRFLRFTNHRTFDDSQHTVYKFCFGNFMYPYFQKRYGFKSVILLRHPFAIAASSMGFGDNYNWHKENYKNWRYTDSPNSGDFFKSYEGKYDLIVSGFSLIVFQAVTQFSYALSHFNQENTVVIYYEDLVIEPKTAFRTLNNLLNKKLDYDLFLKMVKKQSFSSQKNHTEKDAFTQLSKWKSIATEEEVANGMKIFKAFDFKCYSDDVLPLKNDITYSHGK